MKKLLSNINKNKIRLYIASHIRLVREKMIAIALKYISTNMRSHMFLKRLKRMRVQPKFKENGFFLDSNGNYHIRYDGYRDLVVPRWKGMLSHNTLEVLVTKKAIRKAKKRVGYIEKFLSLYGLSLKNRKVLEIGHYDGALTYAIADLGASCVDAIDLPDYYLRQSGDKEINDSSLREASSWLKKLTVLTREEFAGKNIETFSELSNKCNFINADVKDYSAPNTYDFIISYVTLEHIKELKEAIKKMYLNLKSGGYAFHAYTPFFAVDGGHSLCTLDFPWGHVRLSEEDIQRYILQFRPKEYILSKEFLNNNLNRITVNDLTTFCESAGFEIIQMIKWVDRNDFDSLEESIMKQALSLYPTVKIEDLISNSIWILLKKPVI